MSPFADDAISCSFTDLAVSLIKRVVARASDARRSSMMFFEDDDEASPLATAFSVSSRVKSFSYVMCAQQIIMLVVSGNNRKRRDLET